MKRKATENHAPARAAKRAKEPEADYCDITSQKDAAGNTIWPASAQSVEDARTFIKEW